MWAPIGGRGEQSTTMVSRPTIAISGGGCPRDAAVKWLRSGDTMTYSIVAISSGSKWANLRSTRSSASLGLADSIA